VHYQLRGATFLGEIEKELVGLREELPGGTGRQAGAVHKALSIVCYYQCIPTAQVPMPGR